MILPSKQLSQERALLSVGAALLKRLDEPRTVSSLWEDVKGVEAAGDGRDPRLPYDWFVLALDLLFAVGAVSLDDGRLVRSKP
jgi:hypothetical protein